MSGSDPAYTQSIAQALTGAVAPGGLPSTAAPVVAPTLSAVQQVLPAAPALPPEAFMPVLPAAPVRAPAFHAQGLLDPAFFSLPRRY